ncbi:MAG: GIY-YIG nuclease family protein [Oscillochloridaceae bacterium]|nr:GIY-YIG nuclease family protein [Chloroflexaceae bacterium]MDW8389248.1 GIY-YIG nuclease family protein [Oscillochloridaceae bacterium]
MKGTYILVLQLDRPAPGLRIGKLGVFDFAPGLYLYVGSAFGAGGLAGRLAHHRRIEKPRPHWHIDYLRPVARLREAWTVGGPERFECRWCRALAAMPALSIPAPGFGARDSGCRSHLFYSPHLLRCQVLTSIILEPALQEQRFHLRIEVHAFDE